MAIYKNRWNSELIKIRFCYRTDLKDLSYECHWCIAGLEHKSSFLQMDTKAVDPTDFDCILCCRTLWRPVTTPCGHSYCERCLERCLDYSSSCPLCMTSLINVRLFTSLHLKHYASSHNWVVRHLDHNNFWLLPVFGSKVNDLKG